MTAKEVMELMGDNQSAFTDMVSELDLAEAMGAQKEYTVLAPLNTVFTSAFMLGSFFIFNTRIKLCKADDLCVYGVSVTSGNCLLCVCQMR